MARTLSHPLPRPAALARAHVLDRDGAFVAGGALVAVGGLAAANGGYFPTTWDWSALALLWAAAMAIVLRAPERPAALETVFLAGVGGLVAWIASSLLWSPSATRTVLELERTLVYLAAALAVLVLARQRTVAHLLGGTLAGITGACAYGLATRLFPERLGSFDAVAGYRLAEPLGYWNALAILAAIGILLALGIAARGRSVPARAAAATTTVVLLPTLYFTFSRGGWVALGLGLAAFLALDRRRLQLLATGAALAPAGALAVWLGARSASLTRLDTSLADASRAGHALALAIVGLAVSAAIAVALLAFAERRIRPSRRLRHGVGAAILVVALAGLAAIFVRFGSPPALAAGAYDAFRAPPPHVEADLNERLLSFSGNGRAELWRVAWAEVREHPFLGGGAGSYERHWLAGRELDLKVRDAHSLYLETLAELGPIGLSLLLLALGVPVVAAIRARRHPLVPVAFAAYAAFLVHAGVDWDWEMVAVTLAALLCAGSCLVAARSEQAPTLGGRGRLLLLGLIVALLPIAVTGLLGNGALAASARAAAAGDWPRAEADSRRAASFAPWSSEPLRALGEAQLAQGDLEAARVSVERAIARDPGDWALWLDLARATEGPQRVAALAEAARLNPLSPEIALLRQEEAELEADATSATEAGP